ncbi:hypothetical protein EOD39_11763 [Acipenser ruthenus]|uniref:CCHC-type domain-containing protein n=1 Tax=Acipenser ruthenus TaxID=7906 RepID=A0A444UN32_ACIRT|nr:hypothetical protein EOD39_11763 [Acipenser ruthenus]
MKCFRCGEQGQLKHSCPQLNAEAGPSGSSSGNGEGPVVVQRVQVEETERLESGDSAQQQPASSESAAEPEAATASADADQEGEFKVVGKKRRLKERKAFSAAADMAGRGESIWGHMVSYSSGGGSQPSLQRDRAAGQRRAMKVIPSLLILHFRLRYRVGSAEVNLCRTQWQYLAVQGESAVLEFKPALMGILSWVAPLSQGSQRWRRSQWRQRQRNWWTRRRCRYTRRAKRKMEKSPK